MKNNYFNIVWLIGVNQGNSDDLFVQENLNDFAELMLNKKYKESSINYLDFCDTLIDTGIISDIDDFTRSLVYLKCASYYKKCQDKNIEVEEFVSHNYVNEIRKVKVLKKV